MTPEKLGRYEILGELGKGAMGVVYLAQDPIIQRKLAIKTFRMAYSAKEKEVEQFRERFLREAQAIGQLSHPNIVTVHDVGQEEDEYFIAMEYVKGVNLKQQMQREDGPLPLDFVIDVARQIAEGLACAHESGIVHRDIKPANIIITQPQNSPQASHQVKITDFGIARIEQSNLTVAGQLLGTPNYMAPEQIQGRAVDPRTDIFALGVLLYEMLTRKKPFAGENLTQVSHRIVYDDFTSPTEYVEELPEDVVEVLRKALEKNRDKRYQKAAEMAQDLAALQAPVEPLTGEIPVVVPPLPTLAATSPPAPGPAAGSEAAAEPAAPVAVTAPAESGPPEDGPPPAGEPDDPTESAASSAAAEDAASPSAAIPEVPEEPLSAADSGSSPASFLSSLDEESERPPPPPPAGISSPSAQIAPPSPQGPPPPLPPRIPPSAPVAAPAPGPVAAPAPGPAAAPAPGPAAAPAPGPAAAVASVSGSARTPSAVAPSVEKKKPAVSRASKGPVRLGAALAALALVAIAAVMLGRMLVGETPEEELRPSAAEKFRQQEEVLIRRADDLVADGFPEQALKVLLGGIEEMPYSVELTRVYFRVAEEADKEQLIVQLYVQERMAAANALIIGKQYESAYDMLERVLFVDPDNAEATTRAEDIERFLSRRRRDQIQADRKRTSTPPRSRAAPPPPAVAEPPPAPVPVEITITFRTLIADGRVKVSAGGQVIWQKDFKFENRRTFKRKYLKGERGFDVTHSLSSGVVEFEFEVEVDTKDGMESLAGDLLRVDLLPDASPTLRIHVAEDATLKTTWIP